MRGSPAYDAVIVGAGPNGLAAAITLARQDYKVLLLEAKDTVGGGMRSKEVTLPGFCHDICSAIHPLGLASPFLRSLPLEKYGLEWIQPPVALAHPLDGGRAVLIEKSLEATAARLGQDGPAYRRLMAPQADHWDALAQDLLGPLPLPPRHPLLMAGFGLKAIRSASGLAGSLFKGEQARAVFAGMCGHSMLPLEQTITAGFGMMLGGLAHVVGWPLPRHGSQSIANALAAYLGDLGGEIRTSSPVKNLGDLPPGRVILFDLTPRQLLEIAGERLPGRYRRQLEGFRYGPGVFKIDYALDGPIPWGAAGVDRAGTVHVGGTLEEIAAAERAVWRGEIPERPFVLLAQQSLFDPSRAPAGKHTAWAYCHVPHGSTVDMTARIEAQIERFAPGFGELVLRRSTRNAQEMQAYNPNYVGGDINGGVQDLRQFFTRPVARWVPYSTPDKAIYLCSSSTPPGGGVHGMCGYHAARAAMRRSLQ
jgi:phytoene dehydrogenase-like protein